MKITIIETKTKKTKDGEESIDTEHEFECHKYELIGSIAKRFAALIRLPPPPPGMEPTLSVEDSCRWLPPKLPISAFDSDVTKNRFVLFATR